MQQQSYENEAKSNDDDEETKTKASSERENIFSKISLTGQQSNKTLARSDIKRYDTLCPVLLEHRDSILEIRPSQEVVKPCDNNQNNQSPLITINVSGNRFQTYLSTLEIYPDTLLGDKNKREQYWNSENKEYFFDRHRTCFETILYYYQSNGRLRRPEFVPLDTFLEEVSFFQLGSKALAQIHKTENISVVKQIPMPRMLWRRYIWFYLEFPQHSSLARAINLVSIFFTTLSCVSLAIESLPVYNNHWEDICKEQTNLSLNSTDTPSCSALFTSPFFIIQTICVIFFTIEFLLRLISTPSYFEFFLSFFNWVDLATIIPYFVFLGIEIVDRKTGLNTNAILAIRLLRVLRFARIFKLYLIFTRLKALRVLSATVKESFTDLAVMIIILTLIAFLFGAFAYFAEQEENGDVFDSIPKATYWGIITITGVGYGDMYPITVGGRIISCLCAVVGAGMMGMLVSVLVDRYQRVYNRKMYVPDIEISSEEFNQLKHNQDDTNKNFSIQKTSRRRQLSSVISHRFLSVHKRLKPNQRHESSSQSYKVHFTVSFDGENIDSKEADNIVTTMKEKLTEVIPDSSTGINLKLIEQKNNRLWTTYTSSLPNGSNLNSTTTSNNGSGTSSESQDF